MGNVCTVQLRRVILGAAIFLAFASPSGAQLSTATVTGTIRDSSGGVVPRAAIKLHNVDTAVDRGTQSDASGVYSFVHVSPGRYELHVNASGFKAATVSAFTLEVNQSLTVDIALEVGNLQQTVTVEAQATQVENTTAELGTVIQEKQITDLPLNGRNFTQLLTLTPGVSPISVAQNSSVAQGSAGYMTPVTQGAQFTFPSVNGQTNRSNYFMVDGINDQGELRNSYTIPPIVDSIQEFKVNSHNDQAQFGSALGGIVNVVTKSGTNAIHGSLWEFLRNDFFDARNTFLPKVSIYKQNQFGGSFGSPLWIPKIYNGRNKTFIFLAAEGFRYITPANSNFEFPSAANLAGDFSSVKTQLYNPFTTAPDPASPGKYTRQPFPNNQIPSSLLNPQAVAFAKAIFPGPFTLIPGTTQNATDTTPLRETQENYTARIDQAVGTRDNIWFRYSGLELDESGSGGIPGNLTISSIPAVNYGASWVHTFSPTLVLQAQYGRSQSTYSGITRFQESGLEQTFGFSSGFDGNFVNGATLVPEFNVLNYWAAGESNKLFPNVTDIHQYKANVTKVIGRHALQMGGEWDQSIESSVQSYAIVGFAGTQTGNPENSSQPGNALASYLLDVPDNAQRLNSEAALRPGGVMSFYLQDQWKVLNRLTINAGLRYDRTFIPAYGTNTTSGVNVATEFVGDMNFNNGTYVLQRAPAPCSQVNAAPCLPGNGMLPANVVVDPRGRIFHDTTTNFGPRFGMAYRLGANTAVRGGFGIFYDNWAAVTQSAQAVNGSWPSTGNQSVANLNYPSTASATPTVQAQNPFGTAGPLPGSSPFNQGIYFTDPYDRNPYSEQWNFGIQHQFGANTLMEANYVGSESKRLDVAGYYNTALTAGPGTPSLRSPYPYITPTHYDRSIGAGSYHALQLHFGHRFASGLTYQASYTWQKSIDSGSSGWYGLEGFSVENPYDVSANRSVSAFNIPVVFTVNVVYELPIGTGKAFSTHNRFADAIIGNWQTNAIFLARSGQNFTITADGDIANTGNTGYERGNLVGNPAVSNPTPQRWFNAAAFAPPAIYTYGNAGRDILQSQGFWNLDFSVFRQFPIRERMRFQLRAEAFNVLNTVIYGVPGSDVSSPSTFAKIFSTANTPRTLQLAAKVTF